MRDTERYVVDRGRPAISYGPSRTSTGTAWVLSLSTGEERIELELGEQPMYDLWTEVRGVPWPGADRDEQDRLVRRMVHAANGGDEETLLDALAVLEGER